MTDRPLELFWFIPLSGDGAYFGSNARARHANFDYLKQIAIAADHLGFSGALLPVGKYCEDPFIFSAALAPHTRRLRFLAALRPALATPTHWARQSAAIDRISDGRFIVNVVAGGDPAELASDGIFLTHDERYEHAAEFLSVFRRLLDDETVTFKGRHVAVDGARLLFPAVQRPLSVWFGGSSEPAIDIAAGHTDVYLTWGEPLEQVAEKISAVTKRAKARGRRVRFGLRIHLIVRETERAAWDAANRLIEHVSDEMIAEAQRKFAQESDSVGQRRMSALNQGRSRDQLEIAPNLWAGVGLLRRGAGTALVGDPATVARRLREYQSLGIETVIASGYPHLEEAYNVAELLFPELGIAAPEKGLHESAVGEYGIGAPLRASGQ